MLTEDKIKRIAASLLKDYYKFRPRVGATEVRFDQTSGDIIADGHISFTQEDGKVFIATFEATSKDSASEVIYTLKKKILFWDSFAFASSVSSLFLTFLWKAELMTLAKFSLFFNIIGFLGIWLLLFGAFGFLFMKSHRYRYIYAIGQFENYFADDQWIAIDESMFENSMDPYYVELKAQCTNLGFGIIAIDAQENSRVVVAAARQDEFGNKRKQIAFGDKKTNSYKDKAKVHVDRSFNFLKSKFKPIPWKKSLMRFQGEHRTQTFLGIIGLLISISVFVKQSYETKHNFVDEKAYEKMLMSQPNSQEPHVAVIERSEIQKFNDQPYNYLQIARDEITDIDPFKGEADILMHSSPHMFTYYPCERVQTFKGNEVLLQLGLFSNFNNAKKVVLQLTRLGIASNIIWAKCFDESKNGYILTYDDFFANEASAKKKGVMLLKKFKDLNSFKGMKLLLIGNHS